MTFVLDELSGETEPHKWFVLIDGVHHANLTHIEADRLYDEATGVAYLGRASTILKGKASA